MPNISMPDLIALKATVGSDENVWGNKLNEITDSIQATLESIITDLNFVTGLNSTWKVEAYSTYSEFPLVGEPLVIYYAIDSQLSYQWDGLYISVGTGGAGGIISVNGYTNPNVVLTKSDIGLSFVENLTPAQMPISTATQTALNLKANLSSPIFTGTVTLPSTTSIGSVSDIEIGYLDGVTSSIQTQLNSKAPTANPTFTGNVSLPSTTSIGIVDSTEISYLDGVTSGIQEQLNDKQASLVSGINIKTINGNTILGGGDITIEGGDEFLVKQFDTIAQAQADTSLVSGDIIQTLGLNTKGDGKGRYYEIKNSDDSSNLPYTTGLWFTKFSTEYLEKGGYQGTAQDLYEAIGQGGTSETNEVTRKFDYNIGANLKKYGAVLGVGMGGSLDSYLIESPSIWWDNKKGMYGMTYTGYSASQEGAIFLAWANDLKTWAKDRVLLQKNPIAGTPDVGGCTGSHIYLKDGVYYLYYIGMNAIGYEAGTKTLCLATSTDLVTWTRLGTVIGLGVAGTSSDWRSKQIWHPNIIEKEGVYYLFFNASNQADKEQIGYATSTNLLSWTVQDSDCPLISASSNIYENDLVIDPSVYKINDTYFMSYGGVSTLDLAYNCLAYTSEKDFPLGWKKYAYNPILKPTEDYDNKYAHKPYVFMQGGTIYHFYSAQGIGTKRTIALAISENDVINKENPYDSLNLDMFIDKKLERIKYNSSNLGSGGSKWSGGVLAPNGKIYCPPSKSTSVLVYSAENLDGSVIEVGTNATIQNYTGGVLAPNGSIYCIPHSATSVLKINPNDNTYSNFGSIAGANKYLGGVLAPNGKIYCVPAQATQIMVINTNDDSISYLSFNNVAWAYAGGVLAPNGKIYCVPLNATKVMIIDPLTNVISYIDNNLPGSDKWHGGVLGVDGVIYCAPQNDPYILAINTKDDDVELIGDGTLTTESKWSGGCSDEQGKIYFSPKNASYVLTYAPKSKIMGSLNIGITGINLFSGLVRDLRDNLFFVPFDYTNAIIMKTQMTKDRKAQALESYFNKY